MTADLPEQAPRSKPVLTALERARKCAALALDKKGEEVLVLEIAHLTTIADYLVIASAQSDRQVVAIAENIRSGLKKYGKAQEMEGAAEGNWVVIDYGDVVVHVFRTEVRLRYNLEELWGAAPRIPLPAQPASPAAP